jgi:hypothetical protein
MKKDKQLPTYVKSLEESAEMSHTLLWTLFPLSLFYKYTIGGPKPSSGVSNKVLCWFSSSVILFN